MTCEKAREKFEQRYGFIPIISDKDLKDMIGYYGERYDTLYALILNVTKRNIKTLYDFT